MKKNNQLRHRFSRLAIVAILFAFGLVQKSWAEIYSKSGNHLTIIDGGFGEDSFNNCDWTEDIKSISIAPTVTQLPEFALHRFVNVEEIVIADSDIPLLLRTGSLSNHAKKISINRPIEAPENHFLSFVYPNSYTASYRLEELAWNEKVTSIPDYAFAYCDNLKKIPDINQNITFIGRNAFSNCGFTSVTINSQAVAAQDNLWSIFSGVTVIYFGDNVHRIGVKALGGLKNLNVISIADNTVEPAASAVLNSQNNLQITVRDNTKTFNDWLNSYPQSERDTLTTLIVPSFVASASDYISLNNNLSDKFPAVKNVYFGALCTQICAELFQGSNTLESINLGDKITTIGAEAFWDCPSLTTVYQKRVNSLPFVTSIGNLAFKNTNLSEIYLSTNLTTIGNSLFESCRNLQTVKVWGEDEKPNSRVSSIETNAFKGCSSLTDVEAFTTTTSLISIGSNAFEGCSSLPKFTIPSSVTTLGSSAFSGCNNLYLYIRSNAVASAASPTGAYTGVPHIYIEGDVQYLGANALSSASSLQTLTIGKSVQQIQGAIGTSPVDLYIKSNSVSAQGYLSSFLTSGKLKYLHLSSKIQNIGEEAFLDCGTLEKVTFEGNKNIATIRAKAFKGCHHLKEINMTGAYDLTHIYDEAFSGCTMLERVQISEDCNLEYIGEDAYYGCTKLTSFTVTPKVETIDINAFRGATNITEVKFLSNAQLNSIKNGNTVSQNPFFRSIEKATIGADITSVGYHAFWKCENLNEVTFLGNGPTAIGKEAFSKTIISEIALPEITTMGDNAFKDCNILRTVTLDGNVENWPTSASAGAFVGCTSLNTLYVNDNTLASTNRTSTTSLPTLMGVNFLNIYFGKHVRTIGDYAFNGNSAQKDLLIPYTVTKIGNHAFSSLETVTFEENITGLEIELDHLAFGDRVTRMNLNRQFTYNPSEAYASKGLFGDNSELTEVYFFRREFVIPDNTFRNCHNLKIIGFSNNANLKTVGNGAFANCNSLFLDPIDMTKVRYIGSEAFVNCLGEGKSLSFSSDMSSIKDRAFKGCHFAGTLEIPSNITNVGEEALVGNDFTTVNIAVADEALTIASDALDKNSISNFSCNRQIKTSALLQGSTSLTKVTLGGKITEIPEYGFSGCSKLSDFSFQEATKLSKIGQFAFEDCGALKGKLTIPASVTEIGQYAYDGTSYTSISLPTGSKEIALKEYCFGTPSKSKCVSFDCNRPLVNDDDANFGLFENHQALRNIYLGPKVESLMNSMFLGCTNVTGTLSIQPIPSVSFYDYLGCGFTDVTINDPSVFEEEYSASRSVGNTFLPKVERLIFGSNVTEIPDFAFCGSQELRYVMIPTSVKSIGEHAFDNCPKLESFINLSEAETDEYHRWLTQYLEYDYLYGTYTANADITELYIPSDEIANHGYSLGNGLSKYFPNLQKVTFGEDVTTIGSYIFSDCSRLNEVILPEGLVSINDYAFRNATSLNEVTIPSTVEGIYRAFMGCDVKLIVKSEKLLDGTNVNINLTGVTGIELTEGITKIGEGVLGKITNLHTLSIPSTLTTVDLTYFTNCGKVTDLTVNNEAMLSANYTRVTNVGKTFTGLKNLIIGSDATSLGNYAFAATSNLKNVEILNGLQTIGEKAFETSAIESIIIPESVTTISDYAFYSTKYLRNITLPNNLTLLSTYAFSTSAIEEIVIPEGIKTIESGTFKNCTSLRNVVLPTTLKSIGTQSFQGCTALESITIPGNVSEIYKDAFAGCGNTLKTIKVERTTPINLVDNSISPFYGWPTDADGKYSATLIVPANCSAAYQANGVWGRFNIIEEGVIHLVDGQPYTNQEEMDCREITYTRTFSSTQAGTWQALYVPFDITVTEKLLQDFEFAELYMISYKDANNNGEIENDEPLVMLLMKLSEGRILCANTPYFIKARTAGSKTIEVESASLKPAKNGTVYSCTTKHEYTLTGINEPTPIIGKYAMTNKGQFAYCSKAETKLGANRWYLEINSLNGIEDEIVAEARPIMLWVDGEDDPTGIVDLMESSSDNGIYNLNGQKVSADRLHRGIYIKNGKKILMK